MKYVRYFEEGAAWWICRDVGLTCEKLYGPFTAEELRLAAPLHGCEA